MVTETTKVPKYSFDEEVLREYIAYEEDGSESPDAEEKMSKYRREPDGQLSEYEPAQCALNRQKLRSTAQLMLQELMNLGVTQMVVKYDGGSDEGFAHFDAAKTATGELEQQEIIAKLHNGRLGETPETPFYYHPPFEVLKVTRKQWTQEALALLVYEMAAQLLGDGFGTGEYSLEGTFVADLQANILTDIAPSEN